MPQLSFAGGAVPNAIFMLPGVGLHPIKITESLTRKAGDIVSVNHLAVLVTVSLFPHESIAMNILVCDRKQPITEIVSVRVSNFIRPQLSLAEGVVPKADSILTESGLQPINISALLTPNTGGKVSLM